MKVSRLLRWTGLIGCALALLLIAAFGWMWNRLEKSLPPLDGQLTIAGLDAPAKLDRDDQGVVTITATTENDAYRLLGFAHGQDRFFQMDLMRRRSAGELSELFGPSAVPIDRATVVHRFRTLAAAVLDAEPIQRRKLIQAYVAGVNAGLTSLPEPPWEYALLRAEPHEWTEIDTVLVFYSMVLDLQDSTGAYEQNLTTLRDKMGVVSVDFFNPIVAPNDSALDGSTAPLGPPPSKYIIDLRKAHAVSATEDTASMPVDRMPIGSNAIALPGDRTINGAGLLAGDPHLTLRVPNTWYRARLLWKDQQNQPHQATGVTLPGIPGVVIGSNGHIAWTFTNATIDTGDLVAIDLNQVAPEFLYLHGTESLEFEKHQDTIQVKGAQPVIVDSTWTIFGPISARTVRGKSLAYKWTFHDPAAVNFALFGLAKAASVEDAVAIANQTGMPNQNLFVVDSAGAAAWTLVGKIPRRFGYDGRFPVSWTFGDRGWNGYLANDERPVIRASAGQALWSGNQRQIGGEGLERIGDSGYDSGERSGQLERDTAAITSLAKPADLLAVQLDDRADWIGYWHQLLNTTLAGGNATGERAKFAELVANWDGHASINAVGYRLLKTWRSHVARLTLNPIFAECVAADPEFEPWSLRYENALRALHRDQPPHLLSPEFEDWNAIRLTALDQTIAEFDDAGIPLAEAKWGEANRLSMHHPLADVLPKSLFGWLNMPPLPQAGDSRMPRVARPNHGASLRMVVSPGHEQDGIMHLPGGQSGNPLSKFYQAGHRAWVDGEASSFLPGKPTHSLVFSLR